MKKQIFIILLLSLPLIAASGKVKLYLDDTYSDFIMVDKLNCEIEKIKKNNDYIGFRIGNYLFNNGPEIGLHNGKGVEWDNALQGVIFRHQSLCYKFNSGIITKKEYDERLKEFQGLEKDVIYIQQKVKNRVRQDAMEAFQMLDKEVGMLGIDKSKGGYDTANSSNISDDISSITKQIEELPPIKTIDQGKTQSQL